jgi:hypothetical protein
MPPNRMSTVKRSRNPRVCSVVTGRTPLGLAYAHLLAGSTVVGTWQGLSRLGVRRRAQRRAEDLWGARVRLATRA